MSVLVFVFEDGLAFIILVGELSAGESVNSTPVSPRCSLVAGGRCGLSLRRCPTSINVPRKYGGQDR